MAEDTRPDAAKRLREARIARGFKTVAKACEFFGWNYQTYAAHENGSRGFGRAVDTYAADLRVSKAWLLTGEGEGPPVPRLQIKGYVAGSVTGFNIIHETPLDLADRPPALVGVDDAYACWVRGASMEPAFREGDLVVVHPYKPFVAGDYVVIQQASANDGEPVAFIKQFVRLQNGDVVARQLNPAAIVTFPKATILKVHKILSTREMLRA
ncbi:MAG: hypothetical protein KDJ90_06640 [Nitratireductor sp.]|nr:hypothetical protein [Nitratireductor sp.]